MKIYVFSRLSHKQWFFKALVEFIMYATALHVRLYLGGNGEPKLHVKINYTYKGVGNNEVEQQFSYHGF